MKTSTTIISVSTGLGVLGGGGALASHFLSRTTLSEVLKQKGHTFLSFEEDGDLTTWKTIAKAYSSGTNKLGDLIINAPAGDGNISDSDAKKLRQICKDTINLKEYTKDSLLSAEQWCVNPISIATLIANHRTILQLEDSQNDDNDKWDGKVADYVKPNAKNKILAVTNLTEVTADKAEDRKKLKEGCKTLKNELTHQKNFHDFYKQFEEWCTVPK